MNNLDRCTQDNKSLKKHPVDRSNPLSKLFFCWLIPLLIRGYRRELTEDDMYRYREKHDSQKLGDKLEDAWYREKKRKKDPSLLKIIGKIFGMESALLYSFDFLIEGVRLFQPLVLSKLLNLYDENIAKEKKTEAYQYSAMIVFLSFFNVICIHHFIIAGAQIGMKMRIACCSLVYRKALKLSKQALAATKAGQIVNLISNDVSRFDMTMLFLDHLVLGPIEILVGMVLIFNSVGWIGLSGAIFLLISMPIQSYFGRKTSQYRLKTASRTDDRVHIMNEIISGIQVIKMFTWEKPFSFLVKTARLNEMKYIKYMATIRVLLLSCGTVLNKTANFLCIAIYVLTGNVLTAQYVYTTASFYGILMSATQAFPYAVMQFSELLISVKRIKQFLMLDEREADQTVFEDILGSFEGKTSKKTDLGNLHSENPEIYLKNVSAKWLDNLSDNCIEGITLLAKPRDHIAIVGPVGSGKSTLLQVILKELFPVEGTVIVSGTVSYSSQESWVFGGSVRQNILFGQPYDENKYKEVVKVCSLERDFNLFSFGDQTIVGERGITLSGGQKARINLARAVYKEADMYLLDDPLSAVDTIVGKELFENCICGYLKNKCVILVTHQLQYLKKIGKIFLLKNGRIEISGSFEDLKNSDINFTKLLCAIEDEEEESLRKKLSNSNVCLKFNDVQKASQEEKGSGEVSWHVYKSYVLAGGHFFKVVLLATFFVVSQAFGSITEYFVTFWVNTIQLQQNMNSSSLSEKSTYFTNLTTFSPRIENDSYIFHLEFKQRLFIDIFTTENATIYYSILFLTTIVLSVTAISSFYRWCLAVSTALHHKMFDNIVNSPMRFFNTNSSGRILNRFSRDIGAIDETLPMTILDTIMIGLSTLAVTVVIGSLTLWILIPTSLILALFYYLRIVFLASSRNIKRIESIRRSPIYTHLTASLQGLTTIRAFNAQNLLEQEFDHYQNLHSAAYFTFMAANRTFGFWLDFVCSFYVALVIVFLLFVKSETLGGNIGLALTQAITLSGTFQWGMRQWSEMVNQMTSVERIQEYIDLVPEKDDQAKELSKTWPENGRIHFQNVSMRYSEDDFYVLKKLNFVVMPTEKIGIVGRTGAGKSSLIQALFRLTDYEGKIFIDDINTKEVFLKNLRSKISIIPQEPVLFSGSLRKNLDPFDEYEDQVLWSALEEVELKATVEELPAGLENKMAEGGSNFSVGQRQLFCLARAILRNNKILVLDEATANVDPHTDRLIQETIRRRFRNCTVLTIAHRLHTIMDSDKVLVMNDGRVVEFDHPYILLLNSRGIFYTLLHQTGKSTAQTLQSIAEISYYRNNGGKQYT